MYNNSRPNIPGSAIIDKHTLKEAVALGEYDNLHNSIEGFSSNRRRKSNNTEDTYKLI